MIAICTQCQGKTIKKQTPLEIRDEDRLVRFELMTTFVCESCGKYYFDPVEWKKLLKQSNTPNHDVVDAFIN